MSRHQIRLLLCSAASVALIVSALFVLDWFRIDLAGTRMTIGMRAGTVCLADGTCTTVGLRGMGTYRVLAEGAFWNGLLLALLVLAQCGMSVFGGSASQLASRIGYAIGSVTFLCAFGAGYMFAPEPPAELDVLGLVVMRTFGPAMLVLGSLLGVLAVRYAQLEQVSDDVGEYKPVIVRKDAADDGRLPVTPITGVKRVPYPAGDASAPAGRRAGSESGLRPLAGSEPGTRTRAASESGMRTRTPSQQVERIPLPGDRTKSPSQAGEQASERTRSPSQQPAVARTSSQQPAVARTSSQQPAVARTSSSEPAVARTSSSQPAVARTSSPSQIAARTKSASQQPMGSRTTSPAHGVRVRPGSEPPDNAGIDLPSRARTSSSGPIDLAARLSGAPIAVAIKPPLPEPVPVPPDQIPVAPESGLVIRKRTPSAGPLSTHQLPTSATAPAASVASTSAAVPASAADEHIPVPPESGLVIRKKPTAPDLQQAARQAFGSAESPRGASGITPPGAMPSIALRTIDPDLDNPLAPPAPSQLPAKADEPLIGRSPTPGSVAAEPAISRAFTPPDKPAALRGKLKYAVNLATLSSLGITAHREDGTTKHVGWDDIIGIIARRLPAEAPYDGATFVDLVSTAGSTLRILPWTRLDGAPLRGDGEERARAFVQMIAARCLEAKLDSWTKVFAEGGSRAAQLPSTKTLAAHDDKLA